MRPRMLRKSLKRSCQHPASSLSREGVRKPWPPFPRSCVSLNRHPTRATPRGAGGHHVEAAAESRLEPVHRAETQEEREAVYRFRYRVYVEEFGRELGSPDHERKWVTDSDDDAPCTTILYTGSVEEITGTVRLRHWRAGEVPHHDVEELSMDRIPEIEERNTGEIGRLMVRRSMRGRVIIASLLRASYEIFAGEQETDLVFCYCSPGLVCYYQQLAMRPFGGRLVAAPDGMMVPLVAVLSDYAYYRQARSLLAPLVKRYFGDQPAGEGVEDQPPAGKRLHSGKRAPLDLEPYRHLFAPGATGIEFEPERVWNQASDALLSALASIPEDSIRPLVSGGLTLDVPAGTLITRKGFGERELYVVLDGRVEAVDGGRSLRSMGKGELFGEIAFLQPQGRRTATVRAQADARVLILRGRSVKKLMRRDPALGASLQERLAALMAERMGHSGSVAAAA